MYTDDQEYIDLLTSGNPVIFRAFVEAYQHMVINICFRLLLDKQDAEDVAQEVFIEVFSSINQFKANSALSTWLYRIAVSKSLDLLKRKNRKKRFAIISKALGNEYVEKNMPENDRPDRLLEGKEQYELLLQAIAILPTNQRIALSLSKINGLRHDEIAAIMGNTTFAVESLIYRARKTLSNKIKK